MKVALAMVLITMLWIGASAQSSDCTNVLISLSPCLDYITGNSSTPSSGCCTQLATVVRSQPRCLCEVLTGSGASSLGININQTQALELPGACKVQTPPISSCSNGGSPAGSASPVSPTTPEAGSPTGSQTTGPAESPPTITGSNTLPTDNGSSDAISTKLAAPLFFFLLFIAT
ncbi:hypothetical protein LIER_20855 [Lithospermum erythrorhizon]|uniref:Bifunctional inhibitor/plant lipid transfer protein/seed storage helical domain-containing protein n=1 Tax=Lithospermum erythrorhizon TaxID=34254 RepID=A0AAV3QRG2_LITER